MAFPSPSTPMYEMIENPSQLFQESIKHRSLLNDGLFRFSAVSKSQGLTEGLNCQLIPTVECVRRCQLRPRIVNLHRGKALLGIRDRARIIADGYSKAAQVVLRPPPTGGDQFQRQLVASRQLKVHDHPGIVWDEFVGFWVAMWAVPVSWQTVASPSS